MFIDKLLQEQKFGQTGAVSLEEVRQLGKLLGADAVVLGAGERFKPEKSHRIVYQVKPATTGEPSYAVGTAQPTTYIESPQTQFELGSVTVNFRLVDVETGEIIAAGSGDRVADTAAIAIQEVCHDLAKAMRRQFPRAVSAQQRT